MASFSRPFVNEILNQIESLIVEAESQTRPLEMAPYRGQLFELFVTSFRESLVDEEDGPLAADAICRELGDRWGLSTAAQSSMSEHKSLTADQLAKMRSLWSVMRMWMEWTYAWSRWNEFHRGASQESGNPPSA